jgi:hypothetical protein
MSARTRRPLSRRIQQRVFRVLNARRSRPAVRHTAQRPAHARVLTGRRTGKSYRQPVSYVRDSAVLMTPGGGNWKLNLQDGRPERIRLRGRDVLARPQVVGDAGEIERLLGVMRAANPMAGRFVAIPKAPDGTLDRARLDAAVRYGFRIIRWHLDPAEAPAAAH